MSPCIGLRAAYRNSIASTANANTEKATLLGQNNHEFQVVITGSSLYSYSCFSHTVTGHQDEVRACNLTYAGLGAYRILIIRCSERPAANCAALGPKSSSLYVYNYTWGFS
jgi:hypothetical protein